jgi:hypothetical protein
MGKGTTLAMGAAATATTAFAVAAVKAAADDQKQQALLARQLKASAGATDEQVKSVEAYIDATQRSVAVTDTDLRTAMASLTVATGDVTKAQELTNVAINTGAATNKSAAVVADALSKGYAGNMRALATLSPEVKLAIKNGADFNDVVAILNKNFSGAAAVSANTYAGQMFILRNSIDEAKESIGSALLPTLTALIPVFVKVANFAGKNAALFGGLGVALGTAAIAVVAVKGAMVAFRAAAAITTAVNYALATSFTAVQVSTGIGIVTAIAGVAAFVAIKASMDNAAASATNYAGALDTVIDTQAELDAYVGPVANRNLFSDRIAAVEKQKQKLDELKDSLKKAQASLRSYVEGIRDSVTASVSLSSAFSDATDLERNRSEGVSDALKERREAYSDLQQAQATLNTAAYATALDRVAAAENKVKAAQDVKTKSYGDIFREQIAAAKEFGGNLQNLIKAGLGKAGLAQLLNLGPVAGNAVAKDLLAGTGGLTVTGLNEGLASVAAAGTAVGMSIPGVSEALGATVGNTYQITIQAGVGDPVAIGKEVAAVLNTYGAKTGGVPLVVKQPKAAPKKKTTKVR